jgi:ParB-like chromosome segregation protein Spo0J
MTVVQLHPKTYVLKPWRHHMKVHPAADLFPSMSETDLKALGEDIKAHGLLKRVAVIEDPNDDDKLILLDGRNRLDAMELVGLDIGFKDTTWAVFDEDLSNFDPYSYIISTNIHRRHLTAEQRRELIAKLLKATPGKSDRQIADTVKASPTTVGTVRAKMEAKGDVSKLDTRTDTKGRKQPAKRKRRPGVKIEELDVYQDPVTGEMYDSPPHAVLLEEANKFNTEILEFVADYCPRTLAWHRANSLLSEEDRKVFVSHLYQCAEEIQRLAQAIDGR